MKLKYSNYNGLAAILCSAIFFLQFVIPEQSTKSNMQAKDDIKMLSELNAQFIKNFINQDSASHNKIIHKDFVCIESSGSIVGRKEYMNGWPMGYTDSGYTSFSYTDEYIRVFGNVALIRSKTVFKRNKNGIISNGNSVYTDTYVKENGKWLCVQAQITPVTK